MYHFFSHGLAQFLVDETGQDLIEYALCAALVALGAVAAMKSVTTAVQTAFTAIGTSLTNAI